MSFQWPNAPFEGSVHIYIDDSNIAIGGRRLYYQSTGSRTPWNYDIDFLSHIIKQEWTLDPLPTFLPGTTSFYGADLGRSPQLQYLHANRRVKAFHCPRGYLGNEKETDVRLAVDMTTKARFALDYGMTSAFVLVSGDGDFIPAVEKILEYGYDVHIWSWRTSISQRFVRLETLSNNNPLHGVGQLSIYYLDPYLTQLTRSSAMDERLYRPSMRQ